MSGSAFFKVAPFVVGAALAVGGIVVPQFIMSGWAAEEAGITSQVNVLSDETTQVRKETESAVDAVVQEATGLDAERMKRDFSTIQSFLKLTSTWSSAKEYNEGREKAMEKYGVSEDSQFFTEYVPYIAEDVPAEYAGQSKGNNIIDSRGLSLALGDVEVYYAGSDTRGISYVTKFETHTADDKHQSGRNSLLRCTVDADGKLSDVSAVFLT